MIELSETDFQSNLRDSLELLSLEERSEGGTVRSLSNLGDYWLNRDGSVTRKTSWLGRVIRWILNLFCNKTLNDIWFVFTKALKDFEAARKFSLKDSSLQKRTKNILENRRVRLQFVSEFLMTRKDKFDTWVQKKCPEKRVFLRKQIKHYQTIKSGSELIDLTTTLEKVYIPGIRKKMLSKKVPKIEYALSPDKDAQAYKLVDLNELKKHFANLQTTGTHSHGLEAMILAVITRDPTIPGISDNIRDDFYAQLELNLKNILYLIKFKSREKVGEVLQELAVAGTYCAPRWLEESRIQHRNLALADREFEAKILEFIQNIKEEILIKMTDSIGCEYHIINSFRVAFHRELGLDEKLAKLDAFTYRAGSRVLETVKKRFYQEFTGFRLVEGLKAWINLELEQAYDSSYYIFLSKQVRAKMPDIEDPLEYVLEHFWDGENKKQINTEGTVFLLQEIGYLK